MKGDIRNLQILFFSGFLYYGIQVLHWDIQWNSIFMLLFIALLTQSAFCLALKIPVNALKSSLITALGIAMVLRSEHLFVFGLVGFFSISSKYIFNYQRKHFFNPANFGIILSILLTGQSTISTSQWMYSTICVFVLGSILILFLSKIQKIETTLVFIISYLSVFYIWNVLYKGWPVEFFIHDITDGSLMLFAFFIIADPSSTPNNRWARILWVMIIAFFSFYLTYFKLISGASFYALFALSPLVPVLNQVFKGTSFYWDSSFRRKLNTNAVVH